MIDSALSNAGDREFCRTRRVKVCLTSPELLTLPKKALAIASGLFAGGFLFLQFGWDNNAALTGWGWYEVAALLGGIGLAGIFPEARLSAAIGLATAPSLIYGAEWIPVGDSMWPIGLVAIFFFSFPAVLIGSGIGWVLARTRLPRTVYFIALASALIIGALLPNIQNAQRQRLETETVPGLPSLRKPPVITSVR
jgi:hypothetical protein